MQIKFANEGGALWLSSRRYLSYLTILDTTHTSALGTPSGTSFLQVSFPREDRNVIVSDIVQGLTSSRRISHPIGVEAKL